MVDKFKIKSEEELEKEKSEKEKLNKEIIKKEIVEKYQLNDLDFKEIELMYKIFSLNNMVSNEFTINKIGHPDVSGAHRVLQNFQLLKYNSQLNSKLDTLIQQNTETNNKLDTLIELLSKK